MGHGPSTPFEKCLSEICQKRADCLILPQHTRYEAEFVKPYNLAYPVMPAAVFRPTTTQDVSEAVHCAYRHGIHVQAKSGGHSYANYGLGGENGNLMIDLVHLQYFKMNTDNWQATFGSGHRLGDLDKKLHANGKRAMAHGTCPGVGIGGHATIGGIGPSSRMWGTALDHVIEVEVVMANGAILRASKTENPDLFWAIRGAGASFGIVTEFTVRTEPEPGSVIRYSYTMDFGSPTEMAPLYRKWQDLVGDPQLDRRFTSLFIAHPLGALITGTFYGTPKEYKASGIPNKLPSSKSSILVKDWLGSLAHQAEIDTLYLSNIPVHFASRSLALRRQDLLSEKSFENLFAYMSENDAGTPLWFVIFDNEGGAISDVPDNETAYPHRDKVVMYQSYSVGLLGVTDDMIKFVDGIQDQVQKGAPNAHTTYAGYINAHLNRTEAEMMYWGDKLPQLRELKNKYDPTNVFKNPQSIEAVDEDI